MATITPNMKHNVAIVNYANNNIYLQNPRIHYSQGGTALVTGIILLLGTIPIIGLGFTYSIMNIVTLGQVLGILNLVVAWFLYRKELR